METILFKERDEACSLEFHKIRLEAHQAVDKLAFFYRKAHEKEIEGAHKTLLWTRIIQIQVLLDQFHGLRDYECCGGGPKVGGAKKEEIGSAE